MIIFSSWGGSGIITQMGDYCSRCSEDMKAYLSWGGNGNLPRLFEGNGMKVYGSNMTTARGNVELGLKAEHMNILASGMVTSEGSMNIGLKCREGDEQSFTLADLIKGASMLESYAYCDGKKEMVILDNAGEFMLDSGAFTYLNGRDGRSVDWMMYAREYAEYVKEHDIDHYLELDVDSIIGYENVRKLRAEIESITHKPSIPVWHKSRGVDEFRRMCDEYDYVAIGGIVSREIKQTEYRGLPALIKEAHSRGAKVHGLGFTNMTWLPKCHFDSVDSSTWACGRWGQAIKFDGKRIVPIDKPDGHKVTYNVWINNFLEFRKFQDYAKNNL